MKAKILREMTPEELRQQYENLRQEAFNLRLQQTTGQLEKPARIRQVRRDIARASAVMNEHKRVAR